MLKKYKEEKLRRFPHLRKKNGAQNSQANNHSLVLVNITYSPMAQNNKHTHIEHNTAQLPTAQENSLNPTNNDQAQN